MPDRIHPAHPFHLISVFQILINSFRRCHFRNHLFQSSVCSFIRFHQVALECPVQGHLIVQERLVFLQKPQPHPSPFPNRLVSVRYADVRQIVITVQRVVDSILCDFRWQFVHGRLLSHCSIWLRSCAERVRSALRDRVCLDCASPF